MLRVTGFGSGTSPFGAQSQVRLGEASSCNPNTIVEEIFLNMRRRRAKTGCLTRSCLSSRLHKDRLLEHRRVVGSSVVSSPLLELLRNLRLVEARHLEGEVLGSSRSDPRLSEELRAVSVLLLPAHLDSHPRHLLLAEVQHLEERRRALHSEPPRLHSVLSLPVRSVAPRLLRHLGVADLEQAPVLLEGLAYQAVPWVHSVAPQEGLVHPHPLLTAVLGLLRRLSLEHKQWGRHPSSIRIQ